MHVLSAVLVLASVALAEGDRHWLQRAEGSNRGRAAAAPIEAAIAAYERAAAEQPEAIEPRWKLLRALRFKGAYVARTNEEKKAVYSRAYQNHPTTMTDPATTKSETPSGHGITQATPEPSTGVEGTTGPYKAVDPQPATTTTISDTPPATGT